MESALRIIFATGVYEEVLDFDLDELESVCLDKMKTLKSRSHSNVGGWQSPTLENDTYFLNSPLFPRIKEGVDSIAQTYGLSNLELDNLWININGKHHSNMTHTHPRSVISGVFYVKVPENSGDIVFYHPTINVLERDWEGKRTCWNNQNSELYFIKPRENLLLLFPSWINHSVDQNLSDENRISISFNFN